MVSQRSQDRIPISLNHLCLNSSFLRLPSWTLVFLKSSFLFNLLGNTQTSISSYFFLLSPMHVGRISLNKNYRYYRSVPSVPFLACSVCAKSSLTIIPLMSQCTASGARTGVSIENSPSYKRT